MKYVEDQLINALSETPLETDCSVSFSMMDLAGIRGEVEQLRWLSTRRSPVQGRLWHREKEHWTYANSIPVDPPRNVSTSRAIRDTTPPIVIPRIVVKPLRTLNLRRAFNERTAAAKPNCLLR